MKIESRESTGKGMNAVERAEGSRGKRRQKEGNNWYADQEQCANMEHGGGRQGMEQWRGQAWYGAVEEAGRV